MEELKQRILKEGLAKAEGGVVLVFIKKKAPKTIDDFLADGHASGSVIHLCRQSGAQIVGMGYLVEKGFAQGGQFLRDHHINYHALATITRINEDNSIELE